MIVAYKHEYFAFISEIYLQSIEDGEPKIVFDSFTKMMLDIAESCDKRV